MSSEFLWYIPNQAQPGHRGDDVVADHNSLATLTAQAKALEEHGWGSALISTGWGRPDTFTLAAALAARTTRPTATPRTREFLRIVRKLWTEETDLPRRALPGHRRDRGTAARGSGRAAASAAAEEVAAAEADVQLFRGEPLDDVAERIAGLRELSGKLVRDTTDQAWADAEAKAAEMAEGTIARDPNRFVATGQQRLLALSARGEVLDDNHYTAPGKYGGGGAGTTWLVGSAEDVARSLRKYQELGITHFVLSDTPYLPEIRRQGSQLLPLLREPV